MCIPIQDKACGYLARVKDDLDFCIPWPPTDCGVITIGESLSGPPSLPYEFHAFPVCVVTRER